MYPGVSDLLNDLFGTHFTFSFPPMFGTLVAISFLFAAWTLGKELRRKESMGILKPMTERVVKGLPASKSELLWNGLYGFILGFKIVYAIQHYELFFANPQKIIMSLKGNWLAGIGCAILFAWLRYREKEKQKLKEAVVSNELVFPHQLVSEITVVAAIGGIIGAKLFHQFEYWKEFLDDPIGNLFSGSGLTMYGGLIIGAIAVLWYGKKKNIPPLVLCDVNAPGLMLAYGVGRLGCQLAGDGDWGINNVIPKPGVISFLPDWVWSYKYPHNVNNQDDGILIPGCIGNHCNELATAVFPTPLYESIACILLFFVLWSLRKKIKIPGVLFSVYLLLNGIERFFIEQIRVNSKIKFAGIEFSQAQLISSLLVVIGIAGILILSRRKTNESV